MTDWKRGIAGLTAAQAIHQVVGILQLPAVAVFLGQERLGEAYLALATSGLLAGILDLRAWEAGLGRLTRRLRAGSKEEASLTFWTLASLEAGSSLLTFIASAALAAASTTRAFKGLHVSAPLLVAAAATYLGATCRGTLVATIQASGAFPRLAWISITVSVVRATIVVALTGYFRRPVWYLVGLTLAAAVESTLLIRAVYFSSGRPCSLRTFSWSQFRSETRSIRAELFATYWGATLKALRSQCDALVIGAFLGPRVVANYRLVQNVLTAFVSGLGVPFQITVVPRVANAKPHGDAEDPSLRTDIRRFVLWASLLIVIGMGGAAAVAPVVLKEFKGLAASVVFAIPGTMLITTTTWVGPALVAVGWANARVKAAILATSLYLVTLSAIAMLGLAACLPAAWLAGAIGDVMFGERLLRRKNDLQKAIA